MHATTSMLPSAPHRNHFALLIASTLVWAPHGVAAQTSVEAASVPSPTVTDELVLPADHVITLPVEGVPMRFLVTAEANGPARINPEIAVDLQWRAEFEMMWDYGRGDLVRSGGLSRRVDFGETQRSIPMIWSYTPTTDVADGLIGIHHLPYKRIVFPLSSPNSDQTVQTFVMKRIGSSDAVTLGTVIEADGKKLDAFFVLERPENLVTAPTANFIATRFDGGFVPGSDAEVTLDFSIKRRVRMMRLARPLELGELLIDRFAVRYADHGNADKVGEIAEDDPRFRSNEIIVSERKQRGRPDYLTRLGRDQISHCSQLVYDLERREIRLTCGTQP